MKDLMNFNNNTISPASNNECFSISDEMFCAFSELIYRTSGIRLNAQKKGLLTSRLLKRLKRWDSKNFHDYYYKVKADDNELVEMLNCISTNTTRFFRENHHFNYLKNHIIPELLHVNSRNKTIRIWSAGCSTGEESYSIAISLHEALNQDNSKQSAISSNIQKRTCSLQTSPDIPLFTDYHNLEIKILATDISTRALTVAETGIYEYEALPGDMPLETMTRYFLKGKKENEGKIMVKDFLKSMIRFRRLNFKDASYPFKKAFDVIFCRNVMIYFDEAMKNHVLSMFLHHLADGGYLFIGHSESIINRDGFIPAYITVYRKGTNPPVHSISGKKGDVI